MSNIYILGNHEHWHTKQLLKHASNYGNCRVHPYEDLSAQIGPSGCCIKIGERKLVAGDWIFIRQMPRGTLQQIIFRINALHVAETIGVNVVNRARTLELAIDKFLCLALLSQQGIPVPPTFISQNTTQAQQDFDQLAKPVVTKPIFGGRGQDIERAFTINQAQEIHSKWVHSDGTIYQQQMIQHPGWDIRVLAIGDHFYSIKRLAKDGWKTNLSLGGTAVPHALSENQKKICHQVLKVLGGEILAIDLISNENEDDLVLEVNGVPGWKGLEECLQIDVAREIINNTIGSAT